MIRNILTRRYRGALFRSVLLIQDTPTAAAVKRWMSVAHVELESNTSAKISWPSAAKEEGECSKEVFKIEYQRPEGGSYNMQLVATATSAPSIALCNLTPGASYNYSISTAIGDGAFKEIDNGSFDLSGKVQQASAEEIGELGELEIRVGVITGISKHPDADQLYVEQVDVGETEPRTIVSGLVKYCSEETLLNRKVTVLCNLKPRALRGIKSHGMLLCASNEDHSQVTPLSPPPETAVGERIYFEENQADALPAGKKSSKVFEKLAPGFVVNADGVGTFKGIPFSTSTGPCTSTIIGRIS